VVNHDSFSTRSDELQVVVINARGQYSVWPAALGIPAGWHRFGEPAARERCVAAVEAAWTDMRPAGPGPRAGRTVPELFRLQAARAPEHLAVVSEHGSLSYARLEGRSNRLARRLRRLGTGADSIVTVCLERSPDMVVALLAVLKAGVAFLPLDPGLPEHRLARFVEDSRSTAVLTDAAHAGIAGRAELVLPEDFGADSASESAEPLPDGPAPDDLAYMIYTSGSTGAPKGVMIDHRSLASVLSHLVHAYGLHPDDRVLQLGALGFDTSLEQIFTTLLSGGTLVLAADRGWAPTELISRLREHGITVADLTPAYWHQFVSATEDDGSSSSSLRLVIVGGDVVHADDCRSWFRRMPGVDLLNAYGLTETTITSTLCVLDEGLLGARSGSRVPVGSPLPDTYVHLVDERLQPVPAGQDGEICIGGRGVARGFWRQPGRTAEAFLPDPYSPEPGGRMYRTGDSGRLRPDGRLEFLGRVDDQVKIRGFRVEPAEIEAALASHPEVGQAAVVADGRAGEEKILVAFYTRAGPGGRQAGEPVSEAGLRSFLAQTLAGYMLPARLTAVDRLPLDRSGKVDRRNLSLGRAAKESATASTAGTPVSAGISELWSQLLHLEQVGAQDDFFRMGGNSLLAMEMLARVRIMFGIGVTQIRALTRALLEDPTLDAFAGSTMAARAGTLSAAGSGRVDFEAESRLLVPIRRNTGPPPRWEQPADILLTGATGYCGTHLLDILLRTTDARIHCLTRANDARHALERIRAVHRHYLVRDPLHDLPEDRVVPVVGDLGEPYLGLAPDRFEALADTVDLIYHCAGHVNFIYPYHELSPTNVAGTRELIRLAGHSRSVPVHYLSSMAVLAGYGTAGVRRVTEETPLRHADRLSVGYVEAKWVAEALLQKAAAEGLPVAIYRLNDVTGDQRTGVMNTGTEMCALVKFIADAGCSPDVDLPLDFVPADCFARAVTHISTRRRAGGEVYHLTNPRYVFVGALAERLRAFGYRVEELPYPEWVRRFASYAATHPNHPMTSFLPLFVDRSSGGDLTVSEMYFRRTFPLFSRDNTEAALAGSGIEIPPVDADLLDRYIANLLSSGYLARPAAE